MSARLEIECRSLTPNPLDSVVIFVDADRDAFVAHVGDRQFELFELVLEFLGLLFETLDAVRQDTHLGLFRFGLIAATVTEKRSDLFRAGVARGFELLDLDQEFAPFAIHLEQVLERRFMMSIPEHRAHAVWVVAKQVTRQHGPSLGGDYSSPVRHEVVRRGLKIQRGAFAVDGITVRRFDLPPVGAQLRCEPTGT
jgi:hypothetical protein